MSQNTFLGHATSHTEGQAGNPVTTAQPFASFTLCMLSEPAYTLLTTSGLSISFDLLKEYCLQL
jgi:hypothetical protein